MTPAGSAREPRPCVSYLRVSTKEQGASGLGLEGQREAVRRFLDDAGCTKHLREFREVESGTRDDRPELRRALAMCRNRDARLVIAKLDRLGRKAAYVLRLLDESGVDIVFADTRDASPLSLGIMAVVAEDEAKRISDRTKAALAAARERGVKLGNPENLTDEARAKGRRVAAARKRERARERAEDLRDVVEELRADGRTSLRQLAAGLEDRGCLTPGGKSEWSPTQVSRLLARLDS